MRRLTRDPAELIPPEHPGTLHAALARMVDEGRLRALLDLARAQNMFGGPK